MWSPFIAKMVAGRGRQVELHGCRWREPVYRTLRELALSYFNAYFNLRRERTLRRYSLPVNLKTFRLAELDDHRKTCVVYRLPSLRYQTFLPAHKVTEKRLHRIDERLFQAECLARLTSSEIEFSKASANIADP